MDLAKYGLTPLKPERYDASMLQCAQACESKFYLRYVLGLVPKLSYSDNHLLWGGKWHDLMYAWVRPDHTYEELLAALEPWPSSLDITDKYLRTQDRMIENFGFWLEKYREFDEKHAKVIRKEQFFDIVCDEGDDCPYGGCGMRYCGRMDQVRKQDGKEGPHDFKTTGSINWPGYWEGHKHGIQIPGYTWACSHIMGREVNTAFLDVMHTVKRAHELVRRKLTYNTLYIQEWMVNTKKIIARLDWLCDNYLDEPDAWIQNRGSCFDYSRECEYSNVHWLPNYGGDNRWEILRTNYTEDRWKPEEI